MSEQQFDFVEDSFVDALGRGLVYHGPLSRYNGETGELKINSSYTGDVVFEGIVKDLSLGNKIEKAIRAAEKCVAREGNKRVKLLSVFGSGEI